MNHKLLRAEMRLPHSLRFLLRSWSRTDIPIRPRGACAAPFARDACGDTSIVKDH
jgi:hypothetical protein